MRTASVIVMAVALAVFGESQKTGPQTPELMTIGPISFHTKATPEQVWNAIATESGLAKWAAPAARVDLKVGGAYELWFDASKPAGQRGMEGTHILSFAPKMMISHTGRPTCQWMREHNELPWAVYTITAAREGDTILTYAAYGRASGEQCRERFAFYNNVMKGEIKKLENLLARQPAREGAL